MTTLSQLYPLIYVRTMIHLPLKTFPPCSEAPYRYHHLSQRLQSSTVTVDRWVSTVLAETAFMWRPAVRVDFVRLGTLVRLNLVKHDLVSTSSIGPRAMLSLPSQGSNQIMATVFNCVTPCLPGFELRSFMIYDIWGHLPEQAQGLVGELVRFLTK